METFFNIPKIIYQDEVLVIVEKPSGMPSLPAKPGTKDSNTVEGWLQKKFPLAKLVHRLDNETSGLMVAAKNDASYETLRKIWNTDKVIKKYTALVFGKTPPHGKVTTPIAHHPRKKRKMTVGGPRPRPAHTVFKTIQHFKNYSLIEVKIKTGVRHQIRVHLASIGHPVVGDKLYQKKLKASRLFLHLSHIQLPHPNSGKTMKWSSKEKFLP